MNVYLAKGSAEENFNKMADYLANRTQDWNVEESSPPGPLAKNFKLSLICTASFAIGVIFTYFHGKSGITLMAAGGVPIATILNAERDFQNGLNQKQSEKLETIATIYKEVIQYIETQAEQKENTLLEQFNQTTPSPNSQEEGLALLNQLKDNHESGNSNFLEKINTIGSRFEGLKELPKDLNEGIKKACLKYVYGPLKNEKSTYLKISQIDSIWRAEKH